ncbi:MAG: FHA domain-containing protein, partial [Chloroflexota bacterium]
ELEVAVENLFPKQFPLEVLFDFPDTLSREIVRSVLYANNGIVAENNQPPFNQFTLNLTKFEASERILLRVEVTDEIGLSGTSLDIPVQITVQRPEQGVGAAISRNATTLSVFVVAMAGAILILVLILAGRLRPQQLGTRTIKSRRKDRKHSLDPVTQSLEDVLSEDVATKRFAKFTRRLPKTNLFTNRQRGTSEPLAFIVPITESGSPVQSKAISITTDEVAIGSDPNIATITIDDSVVEGFHARLWKNGDSEFYIADQDSVAGTWINYSPISNQGSKIEHGDLLHIANIGYRFILSKPTKTHAPKVSILEETK